MSYGLKTGVKELFEQGENQFSPRTFNKFASGAIAQDAPGTKVMLSGAEAAARGAIEAGVSIATSWPGSPATWVHENLILAQTTLDNFYVEWSTSEAKSFDVALGAALVGKRAFVPIKQVGVNWIVDTLTDWYIKGVIKGGLVVLCGDDPGADTTAEEQDTRSLTWFTETPLLEPTSIQEAKDCIIDAFELSESIKAPVIVRITRQMLYARGIVRLDTINHERRRISASFEPNPLYQYSSAGDIWSTTGIADKHGKYHEIMWKKVQEYSDGYRLNELKMLGSEKIGIIASEMGYQYALASIASLELTQDIAILKLVTTYPIPIELTKRLLETVEKVLIVEELDAFIETQVRAISSECKSHAKIYGKMNYGSDIGLKYSDAYNEDLVSNALAKVACVNYSSRLTPTRMKLVETIHNDHVPTRTATFCPGCPELGAVYSFTQAVKQSKYTREDIIYISDEGCFTCAEMAPWKLGDICTCLGTGVSLGQGVYCSGVEKKVVAAMGDGGFFHNGIVGLVNAVFNKANLTVLLFDNRVIGATGAQHLPSGFGVNARGQETTILSIEDICKSCGVELVETIDPFDIPSTTKAIQKAIDYDGVSVVIARRACSLVETRKLGSRGKSGSTMKTYHIDNGSCSLCMICSRSLACSAIYDQGGKNLPVINEAECIGCEMCLQVCPDNAIKLTQK